MPAPIKSGGRPFPEMLWRHMPRSAIRWDSARGPRHVPSEPGRDKINRKKPQGSALADPSIPSPHPIQPKICCAGGLITGACMMAIFMAAVEGTIVATAMPTIVAELGGFHLFQLGVFTAYFLAQAVTTPDLRTAWRNLFGRKRRVSFVGASIFPDRLDRLRASPPAWFCR